MCCQRPGIYEIVRHVVDNGIKFSKEEGGRVILTTRVDTGCWILQVADEGIGIGEDALPWLFESYRQVGRDKGAQQGAGLGLAIVWRLAEQCGGSVMVESEPGRGSAFTVRLPLAH
jgi:signal transduction histidine kinase